MSWDRAWTAERASKVANLICGTFKLGDRKTITKWKNKICRLYLLTPLRGLAEWACKGCSKKNYHKEDNSKSLRLKTLLAKEFAIFCDCLSPPPPPQGLGGFQRNLTQRKQSKNPGVLKNYPLRNLLHFVTLSPPPNTPGVKEAVQRKPNTKKTIQKSLGLKITC